VKNSGLRADWEVWFECEISALECGQGRNRTADASLFSCTFNDLTDSRWPPKYVRSRGRHANRGLESWVQSQPRNQAYFTVTGRLKVSSWTSRHSYSSCSWRREDLRLQGSTGPKTGGYQSKKGYEQRTDRGSHHDLTNDRNPCVFRSDGVFGNHRRACHHFL